MTGMLNFNFNVTPLVTASFPTANGIRLQAGDGTQAAFSAISYGVNSSVVVGRADGTAASPTAVLNTETLGSFAIRSYDGTAWSSAGGISVNAAENWTSAAHGTYMAFRCITPTTLTAKDCADVTSTGLNSTPIGATTPSTGAFTTVTSPLVTVSTTNFATYRWFNSTGGTDAKNSYAYSDTTTLHMGFQNDALSSSTDFLTVTRSGFSPQAITLTGTSFALNGGDLASSGTVSSASTAAGAGLIYSGGVAFAARSVMSSPVDSVVRLTNGAATSFDRLQLGGGTSSFPAFKRNGTAINVRLADDSADASLTAKTQAANDNSTNAATTAYVDTTSTKVLRPANNLSDVANALTARTNMGDGQNLVNSSTFTTSGGPTSALPSGFRYFHVALTDIVPSTGLTLAVQFSFDGGSTWKAGASDYQYTGIDVGCCAAATVLWGSTAATSIPMLATAAYTIQALANENNVFIFDIYMPSTSAFATRIIGRSSFLATGNPPVTSTWSGKIISGYGIPTNVRVITNTGTIAGSMAVYGNP